MDLLYSDLMKWINLLILPLIRVGGMMLVAPVFDSGLLPARMRLLICMIVTIPVSSTISNIPKIDIISLNGFFIISQELLIGLSIGFVFLILLQTFVIGSQLIAMQAGLGFASMVDPQSGLTVPLISQLYLIIVTLLFLAFNGHLELIKLISNSFVAFPIGESVFSKNHFWDIILLGSSMFAGAISMALPAIVALLIINISFGILTRSAPQLNIFTIGFPITLVIGLFVVYFLLSNIIPQVEAVLSMGFMTIDAWLSGGGK